MKSTVPPRLFAVASNVLFIAYGYAAWLIPILVLHCALLPLNLFRLRQRQQHLKENGNRQRTVRGTILPAPAKPAMHRTEGSASGAF